MIACTDLAPVLQRHAELLRQTRFASFDFEVGQAGERYRVQVRPGTVQVAPAPASGMRANAQPAFVIEAAHEAWAEFARPLPRPGYHDIVALVEAGHARVDGADMLSFFRHQFLVKGLLAALFTGEPRA